MFTQAGFNWRRRAVCRAFIWRGDRRWTRPATLVRFYDIDAKRYTEYVWDSGGERFSWPHLVEVCSLDELTRAMHAALDALGIKRLELSPLP